MATMRNCDRILEAIDQLRGRKARPDIQRICNYLFRRFAMNSTEAKANLEWCVANNIVLRVEYKGSISYRNAAKKFGQLRTKDPYKLLQKRNMVEKSTIDKNLTSKKLFSEMLTNAIGELIVQEPDYLEIGVPASEIIGNILSKDSVRYTKKYINILLEKEVERGGLIKTADGNFLMGPGETATKTWKNAEPAKSAWKPTQNNSAQNGNTAAKVDRIFAWKRDQSERGDSKSPRKDDDFFSVRNQKTNDHNSKEHQSRNSSFENGVDSATSTDDKKSSEHLRIGGRRKRAKKVFDPSDSHVPKKRGRPIGSLNKSTIEKQMTRASEEARPDSRTSTGSRDHGGVCSVCHVQSKRGPNDRMVACRECSNKAHFSCLNGDDMMLKMYPDNTWQCPHCKTCVVCFETADAGNLTVCSVCADPYHAGCHQPRVEKSKPSNKWLCSNCQMSDELKITQIQSNLGSSFSSGKGQSVISSRKSNYSENNDPSPSDSRSSSPSFNNSPPLSPTPPRLSPQNVSVATTNGRNSPDSESDSKTPVKEYDFDDNIDPSIPDATHWTPDEVASYFAQWFPEESKIFKEQEIDGRSLLLLKRLDVLTSLNLKLGPALKIYRHVVMLQVRRDDPKLYWL